MLRRFAALITAAMLLLGVMAWRASVSVARAPHHAMTHMAAIKGGMGMSMKMSPEAKRFRKKLDTAKSVAARKGKYACCIKPSCDWCMTHMGSCSCGKGVAMNMGACRECKGGWEAGQGAIGGKTKDDVRNMKTIGI